MSIKFKLFIYSILPIYFIISELDVFEPVNTYLVISWIIAILSLIFIAFMIPNGKNFERRRSYAPSGLMLMLFWMIFITGKEIARGNSESKMFSIMNVVWFLAFYTITTVIIFYFQRLCNWYFSKMDEERKKN